MVIDHIYYKIVFLIAKKIKHVLYDILITNISIIANKTDLLLVKLKIKL